MSARTLAAIAVRIWGIVLLAGTLASCPVTVFYATLAAREFFGAQPDLLLNLAGHFLVAVALIVFAEPVARWAMPDTSSASAGVGAGQVGILAFALVGIFLLVEGVQDVAVAVYMLATKPPVPLGIGSLSRVWERQRELIVRSIPLIVASGMIFWRDRLARAWWAALAAVRRPPMGD